MTTIYLTYIFSIFLTLSAILAIVVSNPLHAVLSLVSSFLFASLLIFLLENEFLALFFLIIYLGAIAILFLFVVMMLDIKYHELQASRLYLPAGLIVGGVLFLEANQAITKLFITNTSTKFESHNVYSNWYDTLDSIPDILVIGQVFYTQYLLQILIAGLILYIAVIGVAFLTVKGVFERNPKAQSLSKQIARKNVL